MYGGLCALASFDRNELRTKVFENSDFKQYLELEPTIRELLYSFYNSRYTVCLEIMNRMKVGYYRHRTDRHSCVLVTDPY